MQLTSNRGGARHRDLIHLKEFNYVHQVEVFGRLIVWWGNTNQCGSGG